MKKIIKKIIFWCEKTGVSIFCRVHFRRKTKQACKKTNIKKIDFKYKRKAKKYWKKYGKHINTYGHEYYSGANGHKDVRYIPEDIFYSDIERYFNNFDLVPAYEDKSIYKDVFPDVKQPKTILINKNSIYYNGEGEIITKQTALTEILKNKEIVIKPTINSGGGKNVGFYEGMISESEISNILDEYEKDFIVQEPIDQNSELARLHKSSVNTIRVTTLMIDDKSEVLSSVIRFGAGGSRVDNECSGGFSCGIDKTGKLLNVAYDSEGKQCSKVPGTNLSFSDIKVPSYAKIVAVATKSHERLPYFRIISWDFSVDKKGEPIMIEYNLRWQGVNFHQLNHGPLFGEQTDEILNTVYSNHIK